MKRLVTVIMILATFVMSVGFSGPSKSNTKVSLKEDTTTVAEINVSFGELKVKEPSNSYSKYLKGQAEANQDLTQEIRVLNEKIPDMNSTQYQTTVSTLEQEYGINEEDVKKAVQKDVRLTNWKNFIIFLSGLGIAGFLINNSNHAKRGPDVALKLGTGVLLVALLGVLRIEIGALITSVFNPTYQIIEQFIMLGG